MPAAPPDSRAVTAPPADPPSPAGPGLLLPPPTLPVRTPDDTAPPPADKPKADSDLATKEKDDRSRYIYTPPLQDIFTVTNDDRLEERLIERLRQDEIKAGRDPFVKYPKGIAFPRTPPAGLGLQYVAKTGDYPPRPAYYVNGYVVHRRLHFEEKNAERYGWDLGIIQPLVSTAYFYKDVLLWPNSLASCVAYGCWDTNAGKCLPGSPTPYYLYPPGLTLTGAAVEGLVITGTAFLIP